MAASPRPGEITYYDELGVERGASAEQIRDAFRGLARILHPDQQTDQQLKETAERQMRKLNRIYAVLSDADKRREYDESLDGRRSTPVIVISPASAANVRKLAARAVWAMCIAILAVVLIWIAFDTRTSDVSAAVARGGAQNAPAAVETYSGDPVEVIARLRTRLRSTEQERNAALQEVSRLRNELLPQAGAAPKSAAGPVMTELPQAPVQTAQTAAPASAPSPAAVQARQFTGVWIFSRLLPGAQTGRTQYPPEFVEATLTEVNGQIHGQYRSRYQILDHAISPDVNFDFAARPDGSVVNAPWRGPGGARGRVTLKLTADNLVEVNWNASELGSQQWLVSGAAVLARKP